VNRNEIRAAARAITDLDESDISNELLDMYMGEGYRKMVEMLGGRWPFFEIETVLAPAPGQKSYSFTVIGSGNLIEIATLTDGDGVEVEYIDHNEAQVMIGPVVTGPPRWHSFWSGNLYLWPTPDGSTELQIIGFRAPITWWESDAEVDADHKLHATLINYVVSMMYVFQEDTDMAAFYRRSFDESVLLAKDDLQRAPVRTIRLSKGLGTGSHSPRLNWNW
jgi:hypothetical protein